MATYETLKVKSPEGDYSIYLGAGVLGSLIGLLTERGLTGSRVVITNSTLVPIYGHWLARTLGASLITIPDGEQYKTLDTVRTVYDTLIEAGADRYSVIVALGGGVVGDLAGFVAATYLRGVPFVQIPTTLLSMIDSSVGGKVGVDLPQGKNLIGAYKQPTFVAVDTELLSTLPDSEWRCGAAEALKHGLLRDPGLLDADLYRRDSGLGLELIRRAVSVKIDIVAADPYEHGLRAVLNLGHTFAHAIEQVSGYTWRHGEAVGFGLVAATRLSHMMGMCNEDLPKMVEELVGFMGLPTRCPYDPEAVRAAMNTDKKRSGGAIRFVLLRGIGSPELRGDVPDKAVIQVLSDLRG